MAETPQKPEQSIVEIINGERRYNEKFMKAHLEQLGIQVSGGPGQAWMLRYSYLRGAGPTLGAALFTLVEQLLKLVPVEKAQSREDEDTQHSMEHHYLGGE